MSLHTMQEPKKQWVWDGPKEHGQGNEEVRACVRFPLHLPVKVEAEEHNWIEATTEDISASGFLFLSTHEFAEKAKFEFTIQMPAAVMGTPTDVVVHGSARVVRSYKKEPMNFTAAVIDDYSFRAAIAPNGSFQ